MAFRPVAGLIDQANTRLMDVEGHALEDLAGQIYEERSRLGLGGFPLSERIRGYRDRADVEIDLVAINEDERRIPLGTCKRNPARLPESVAALQRGAARFLDAHARFKEWRVEFVAIAPTIADDISAALAARDVVAESLADLTAGL